MKDGSTRKLHRPRATATPFERFQRGFDVRLVAVAGPAAGTEYRLARERLTLGRGPGVDLTFDDPAMSRQHAAVEFTGGQLRVRDLGSTNGLRVNGAPAQTVELKHGDRLQIGTWTFQVLVESRAEVPETYELTSDA